MNTLSYIVEKFDLNLDQRMPVEIVDFGRDNLAELFAELGFKVGVEVGVQQAEYAEVLCRANPGLKLYGIDVWQVYSGYREYVSQAKLDAFHEEAVDRMKPYDWHPIQKFSMEAVKDFENRSLDFVYIDANHDYQNVVNDVVEWSKKVRKGGIVSGHDFLRRLQPTAHHVVQAVQGYTHAYNIKPWFVLGRRAKLPGEVRDGSRSWMWVKG